VQYAEDVPALLTSVLTPLKAGGVISVVSVNRYSVPYHAAFLHGNLEEALARLDQHSGYATIFDATMQLLSGEEIADLLSQAGCIVDQHYGIRCLCDYWGDNVRKADPNIFAQIERLERALSHRYPYKLLARYFQIVAHKR
jgi:S-adenosylmethionine-dependent methyltransferase